MPADTRPLNAYDTVEITSTHPISELHGARGTIALPLCHSVLVMLDTYTYRDGGLHPVDFGQFANFGPFCRIERRHLLNRNVPPHIDDPIVRRALALELTDHLPLTHRLPLFEHCPIHSGALMHRRIKNGRHWYSHKVYSPDYEGFRWCHGYRRWFESPIPSDWLQPAAETSPDQSTIGTKP